MDAATTAAVVALLVAILALIISLAQVVQQYIGTGQLIRICDSVVFGKMPGHGRRIWQASQFRFRVVYSVPQIKLPADLWPSVSPHTPAYSNAYQWLPDLQEKEDIIVDIDDEDLTQSQSKWKRIIQKIKRPYKRVPNALGNTMGEASWVSFCRAIQYTCGETVRYEMVQGDADRCPTDLPAVPMQVSLRDVITMAIMTGMDCTHADFEEKTISMQGASGTISSSRHPILGPLIHFVPTDPYQEFGMRTNGGKINSKWMCRMWDVCNVAGRSYNRGSRSLIEDDEMDWQKQRQDDVILANDFSRPKKAPDAPKSSYAVAGDGLVEPFERVDRLEINIDDEDPFRPVAVPGPHDGTWYILADDNKRLPQGRRRPRVIPHFISSVESDISSREYNRNGPSALRWKVRGIFRRIFHKSTGVPSNDSSSSALPSLYERTRFRTRDMQDPGNLDSRPIDLSSLEAARRLSTAPSVVQVPQQVDPETPSADANDYVVSIDDTTQPPGLEALPYEEPSLVRQSTTSSSRDETIPDVETSPLARETEHQPIRAESCSSSSVLEISGDDVPDTAQVPHLTSDPTEALSMDEEQRATETGSQEQHEGINEERQDQRLSAEDDGMYRIGGMLLLEYKIDSENHSEKDSMGDKDEDGQNEKYRGRRQREQARRERMAERRRKDTRYRGLMKWFWASQMDINPGFWATTWKRAFDHTVCVGTVAVVLEALQSFTTTSNLCYVSVWSSTSSLAVYQGKDTFPSYARNARGGVVVSGGYKLVKFPAFGLNAGLPPIELIQDYDHQVSRSVKRDAAANRERLVELMGLDSWLSFAGRSKAIIDGKGKLLNRTPAFVQWVMELYEEEFRDLDRNASDGGLQAIHDVSENVRDTLDDQSFSEAEKIFLLVALLRTVKVGICISQGADAEMVEEIILKDVQVCLV